MVQFLSIIFFLDFFNFCWVFQNFPFFCVTLYKEDAIEKRNATHKVLTRALCSLALRVQQDVIKMDRLNTTSRLMSADLNTSREFV